MKKRKATAVEKAEQSVIRAAIRLEAGMWHAANYARREAFVARAVGRLLAAREKEAARKGRGR